MSEEQCVEAFHIFWDAFPERVRLIRKDRTVIAVNRAAEALGLRAGVRCVEQPPAEGHIGCMAAEALRAGEGRYGFTRDGSRLRFWIPIDGNDDMYVHFSIPAEGTETPGK